MYSKHLEAPKEVQLQIPELALDYQEIAKKFARAPDPSFLKFRQEFNEAMLSEGAWRLYCQQVQAIPYSDYRQLAMIEIIAAREFIQSSLSSDVGGTFLSIEYGKTPIYRIFQQGGFKYIPEWMRFPAVSVTISCDKPETKVETPFGNIPAFVIDESFNLFHFRVFYIFNEFGEGFVYLEVDKITSDEHSLGTALRELERAADDIAVVNFKIEETSSKYRKLTLTDINNLRELRKEILNGEYV